MSIRDELIATEGITDSEIEEMSRADKIAAWLSDMGNSGVYYFGHGFDAYQGNSAIVWLCVLMLVWCLEATRLTTKFDLPNLAYLFGVCFRVPPLLSEPS